LKGFVPTKHSGNNWQPHGEICPIVDIHGFLILLRFVSNASASRTDVDELAEKTINTKKVKGTEERLFSVRKENLHIPDDEIETSSQEDHVRYFSVFHTNLLRQATAYLTETSPRQYKQDGFAYWNTPLHLTDEEFQELVQSMNKCIEAIIHNEPTPERVARIFAGAFIPRNPQR
jgi:hypothetical protein